MPLGIKGAEFLIRDYRYRVLAAELTQGLDEDEAKAEALLRWTRARIRPTPSGWPVMDDHISNIIVRGYGESDQIADVFTTLATYAGIPAFWRAIRNGPIPGPRIASFLRINGRWTAWDAAAGTVFRDAEGSLMSVQELGWGRFDPPSTLRAEKQIPVRRTIYELKRAARRLLGRPVNADE